MTDYKIMLEEPTFEICDIMVWLAPEDEPAQETHRFIRKEVWPALREAAPTITVPDWQPIETAPLGLPVWGECFEDYNQVVIFQGVDNYDDEAAYIFKSQITDKYVSVTRWMPLPQPPKGDE